MNKKLIKRIEQLFFEKLDSKTNWGKEQVKSIYKECMNQAILEMLR